jgi:DNA-binding CsgD family transcriptional regulator
MSRVRATSDELLAEELLTQLSPRQKEVLACLARGHSNKEIGETLGISVRTVEGHLSLIYDCIGVRTRAAVLLVLVTTGALDELSTVVRNR